MTSTEKKILEDALALPEDQRRVIAQRLLESVAPKRADEDAGGWIAEAVRHTEEPEDAEVEGGDAEAAEEEADPDDLRAKVRAIHGD